MPYTVRVRGVEIVCDALEDIDRLIERYGDESLAPTAGGAKASMGGGPPGAGAADLTLLRTMVSAGSLGVSSEQIGHMLNTKGKGIPNALQRWAIRIGITEHADGQVFDSARPQGARGWKLKDGALAVAKTVLGQA